MQKLSITTTKQNSNVSRHKITIGLDLGDRWRGYCVLEESGNLVVERRVTTTDKALREAFCGMPMSRIALETAMHSPWVSRLLTEFGHEVIVVIWVGRDASLGRSPTSPSYFW